MSDIEQRCRRDLVRWRYWQPHHRRGRRNCGASASQDRRRGGSTESLPYPRNENYHISQANPDKIPFMSPDAPVEGSTDASKFDPFSDSYSSTQAVEVNHCLRRQPIAYSSSQGGFWPLSTHRDVLEGFRHDGKELSARHETLEDGTVLGGVVLPSMTTHLGFMEQDPPFYTPIRRALTPRFAPREMSARRDRINDVAAALLDRRIASGTLEMLDDLIRPLAGIATLELLGLPLEGLAKFAFPVHKASHNLNDADELRAVWTGLKADIAAEIDSRDGLDRGDIIDAVVSLEVDGQPVSSEFIVDTVFILLLGGVETVTGAFAGAINHLNDHHEHRRELIERPELLQTAFDEYLRYVTPTTQNARTALVDFDLAGCRVRRGDRVFLNLFSANRDEDVFPRPDEVLLERSPNRHMALGHGMHHCIGEYFAKEIWISLMSEVLTRIPDFELDLDRVRPIEQVGLSNGFVSMPATFTPGAPRFGDEALALEVELALASLEN